MILLWSYSEWNQIADLWQKPMVKRIGANLGIWIASCLVNPPWHVKIKTYISEISVCIFHHIHNIYIYRKDIFFLTACCEFSGAGEYVENGNLSTPPVVNSCNKNCPPKSKQQVVWEDYNIVLVLFTSFFVFFPYIYRPSTHFKLPLKGTIPSTGQAKHSIWWLQVWHHFGQLCPLLEDSAGRLLSVICFQIHVFMDKKNPQRLRLFVLFSGFPSVEKHTATCDIDQGESRGEVHEKSEKLPLK